jgi:hypothetical protein
MNPDDKTLLSALLDDEANPDEVARALELLERKPELMAYVERQQWLRAHWQKEYSGPQLDLRAGIWEKISAEVSASEAGLVDELALRREARGLTKGLSVPEVQAPETRAKKVGNPEHRRLVEADASFAPLTAEQQVGREAGSATDAATNVATSAEEQPSVRQKRWWQSAAQFAVAASVCFGVVGIWYLDQPNNLPETSSAAVLATNESVPVQVPFNESVAGSQTAVASKLAASLNNRATVAAAGSLGAGQPGALLPHVVMDQDAAPQLFVSKATPENPGLNGTSDYSAHTGSLNFVSLDSLAAEERARLQSYYMMHTGNSALLQPIQGMQLVRIVDTPPSPLLRSASGQ